MSALTQEGWQSTARRRNRLVSGCPTSAVRPGGWCRACTDSAAEPADGITLARTPADPPRSGHTSAAHLPGRRSHPARPGSPPPFGSELPAAGSRRSLTWSTASRACACGIAARCLLPGQARGAKLDAFLAQQTMGNPVRQSVDRGEQPHCGAGSAAGSELTSPCGPSLVRQCSWAHHLWISALEVCEVSWATATLESVHTTRAERFQGVAHWSDARRHERWLSGRATRWRGEDFPRPLTCSARPWTSLPPGRGTVWTTPSGFRRTEAVSEPPEKLLLPVCRYRSRAVGTRRMAQRIEGQPPPVQPGRDPGLLPNGANNEVGARSAAAATGSPTPQICGDQKKRPRRACARKIAGTAPSTPHRKWHECWRWRRTT